MHHLTFHSLILPILCPPPPISYFTPFLIFLSLSSALIVSLLPRSACLPSDAFVLPLKTPIALWPQIDFIGQHHSR